MRIPSKTELIAPIFVISIWVVLLVLFLYSISLECIVKIIISATCIIVYVWLTAYVIQYIMKKINE
jgi:FtsH-binding integral membrane protein